MAAWSDRHHGIEPHGIAVCWLRLVHRCVPTAARTRPAALTAAGVWCALAATVAASHGRGWAVLGAALLLAGAVFDGLDGAVAAYLGRVSRWGAVLDTTADRVADAALLAGLGLRGAPAWVCAVAYTLVLVHEGRRGRRTVITVGERPVRVLLGMAGFVVWPGVAAGAIVGLSAISIVQLARSAPP